ncbi:MAG: VTT domain-containing protein [Chlamydiota bacterium]
MIKLPAFATKKGLILPALLVLVIVAVYVTGIYNKISYSAIQAGHMTWKTYALQHPIAAASIFMGIYILSVILIIPDSTILTLIGGFLFPLPLAITYALVSETIGATLFFLIVRQAFADQKKRWKIPFFKKEEDPFAHNQANYLLFLRLSHLFPFWLINTLAAIYRARVPVFIWTTLVGVAPLAILFSQAGEGLSTYVETHVQFKIGEIFNTQIKISLIILGCLPLLPIIYKKLFKK